MSHPRYPAYVQTDVPWLGEIPKQWGTQRLKILFEIVKTIAKVDGLDVLSVTQKGIRIKDTESNAGQLSMDYSKYQIVHPGDYAMNHMDLLTGYVDVSAFYGVTSPDYRVFRLRDHRNSRRFFLYLLQNCYHSRLFFPFGQGSSQLGRWRLPTEAFNEFIFPVPSPEEQTAIAAFLDRETAKIDALVEEQTRLIDLLKEKRQAVISHAVTKGLNPNAPMKDSGIEWLGEVPEHWEVRRLKAVADLIDGDRSSAYPSGDDVVAEGIPFLSSRNIVNSKFQEKDLQFITEEKFSELSRGKIRDGDLAITVRGTIGHVAIFDPTVIGYPTGFINAQMMIMRPVGISPAFLHLITESRYWREQLEVAAYGTAQQQLSNGVLKEVYIVLPPLAERDMVTQHLSVWNDKIEELIRQSVQGLALLQERRAALISAAVTGKIDVRTTEADSEAA